MDDGGRVVRDASVADAALGAERDPPPPAGPAPAHGPRWRRTAEHVVAP